MNPNTNIKLSGEAQIPQFIAGDARSGFIPPDNGDLCWQTGSEIFTRKEVASLLWTQRAMISNDLKTRCGNDLTQEMYAIIDDPRMPTF